MVLGTIWALGVAAAAEGTSTYTEDDAKDYVGAGGLMKMASEGDHLHVGHLISTHLTCSGMKAFDAPGAGVVARKDWSMVGMEDFTYAIRVIDKKYDFVKV